MAVANRTLSQNRNFRWKMEKFDVAIGERDGKLDSLIQHPRNSGGVQGQDRCDAGGEPSITSPGRGCLSDLCITWFFPVPLVEVRGSGKIPVGWIIVWRQKVEDDNLLKREISARIYLQRQHGYSSRKKILASSRNASCIPLSSVTTAIKLVTVQVHIAAFEAGPKIQKKIKDYFCEAGDFKLLDPRDNWKKGD